MGATDQAGESELPSPSDKALQVKMETAAAILSDPKHPDRARLDAIKNAVEARVKAILAPVVEAIATSERITQEDLAVRINARG